jgi:hypothetical protein
MKLGRKAGHTKRPVVFAMSKEDTGESKHLILWAKDGDLNAAKKRGNVKRVSDWGVAVDFAAGKARQIGATKRKRINSDHATYEG